VRLLFSDRSSTATLTLSSATTRSPSAAAASSHATSTTAATTTHYSYGDLRSAYLRKVQELHPDRNRHSSSSSSPAATESSASSNNNYNHEQFVELQEAWQRFDQIWKRQHKIRGRRKKDGLGSSGATSGGDTVDLVEYEDANFTMFGVGCSFSDSDAERALRTEITDQACRGWFSAGSLPHRTTGADEAANDGDRRRTGGGGRGDTHISLSDDDMFVEQRQEGDDDEIDNSNIDIGIRRSSSASAPSASSSQRTRPSLVSHLLPPLPRGKSPRIGSRRAYSRSTKQLHSKNEQDEQHLLKSFADLDYGRGARVGFPEAVFAEGKTPEQVAAILDDMARNVNESIGSSKRDGDGALWNRAESAILATRYRSIGR